MGLPAIDDLTLRELQQELIFLRQCHKGADVLEMSRREIAEEVSLLRSPPAMYRSLRDAMIRLANGTDDEDFVDNMTVFFEHGGRRFSITLKGLSDHEQQ